MKIIDRDPGFAGSDLGRRLIEIHDSGSASARAIADHLLRNPMRATAAGIEELASTVGVSTATMSRFARAVGFNGFAELRIAMAETLETVLRPVEKLRAAFERTLPETTLVTESMETTLGNLRSTAEALKPELLAAVVAAITRATTVHVMGFGLSSHLAGLLSLGLQPFCPQLVNVVEFGGTEVAAGRLMNIGADDVLIVISFPRYARDAVHLARYARDRGAVVVAITDSIASPLTRLADHTLVAESAHPVVTSSMAAAIMVIETIVTALMISNDQNVAKAARLTDAIADYLLDVEPGRSRPRPSVD